jgi:hypothetical protein
MNDKNIVPMSAENVEDFDVWVFDSQVLVISVVPHLAPWGTTVEEYVICRGVRDL